jgi:galactose mutarotase-like enzyme|tara:strand:+ start:217 stop:390 length:174 start_codon:yes stop_codon:yes gene_type:complete
MLNGKKTLDITISIHTDITLDTPFGSSFHPNFLIKGLSQNFITINNQIGLCSNIVNN